jgi:UDP:flavonoid glycosyltransferase YjiC (YdhE family)
MDAAPPFSGSSVIRHDGPDPAAAPSPRGTAGPGNATVTFCWELGGGLGHLMQMLPLASDLSRRGHRVFVVTRDLDAAAPVFRKAGVRFLQAPVSNPCQRRFPRPVNYAQLLANNGFGADGGLFARASAWRNLFLMVRPDLLVFDHAPTALLASRGLACRRALIGSGFCCPPDDPGEDAGRARWAVLRPHAAGAAGPAASTLAAAAEEILARVNRQLDRWRLPHLPRLGQLYAQVDENFLTTFRELDHFPRPQGCTYWGPVVTDGDGDAPQWPTGEGPRVFAYLKPFPALPALLDGLQESGCRVIVGGHIGDEATHSRAAGGVDFAPRPLDVAKVAGECDLAILNGGHGVTAQMLLAGRPTLQIPLAQEQQMLADAVARLGAGEVARAKHPDDVRQKLALMLSSDRYRSAAAAFARRYAAFDPRRQRGAMLARSESLLSPRRPQALIA